MCRGVSGACVLVRERGKKKAIPGTANLGLNWCECDVLVDDSLPRSSFFAPTSKHAPRNRVETLGNRGPPLPHDPPSCGVGLWSYDSYVCVVGFLRLFKQPARSTHSHTYVVLAHFFPLLRA